MDICYQDLCKLTSVCSKRLLLVRWYLEVSCNILYVYAFWDNVSTLNDVNWTPNKTVPIDVDFKKGIYLVRKDLASSREPCYLYIHTYTHTHTYIMHVSDW